MDRLSEKKKIRSAVSSNYNKDGKGFKDVFVDFAINNL